MVLDLSKIEAGKMEIVLQNCDLTKEINQLLKTLDYEIKRKGLTLDCQITNEIKYFVEADITRINQVLLNLLNNSIKFTVKGCIRFSIASDYETESHYTLRFTVSDDGIGIPKHRQSDLFTAFNQTDGSITRRYGGTGLGLAISKLLVNLMGSEITFQSEEGIGSTFSFTLVLKKVHPLTKNQNQLIDNNPKRIKKILIAEDNQINQRVILLMLKTTGMQTSVVNNGSEAVQIFAQENFDLVLMDLQMPEMDGFEALNKIREIEKNKPRKTPVIAVTANAMTEDRKKALDAGFDGFVGKPINRVELEKVISKVNNGDHLY